MEMTKGISDHSRAYLTGVTVSCGSRSTCMCNIRRQNDARRSNGKLSSDMHLTSYTLQIRNYNLNYEKLVQINRNLVALSSQVNNIYVVYSNLKIIWLSAAEITWELDLHPTEMKDCWLPSTVDQDTYERTDPTGVCNHSAHSTVSPLLHLVPVTSTWLTEYLNTTQMQLASQHDTLMVRSV